MLPLSKRDTAYFIRALCRKHQVSPRDVLREIHDDGIPLTDTISLCYLSGVYYIHQRPVHAVGVYHVCIEEHIYAQHLPRATALALAEKLCQLLFTAREISVWHNDQCIQRWIRIRQSLNRWRLKEY